MGSTWYNGILSMGGDYVKVYWFNSLFYYQLHFSIHCSVVRLNGQFPLTFPSLSCYLCFHLNKQILPASQQEDYACILFQRWVTNAWAFHLHRNRKVRSIHYHFNTRWEVFDVSLQHKRSILCITSVQDEKYSVSLVLEVGWCEIQFIFRKTRNIRTLLLAGQNHPATFQFT